MELFHCCWCVELWSCCVSRPQRAGGGSALKLKKKDKDVDMFVDKLVQEGERVTSVTAPRQPSVTAKTTTSTPQARWKPPSPPPTSPFFPSLYLLPQYVIPLPPSVPVVNIHPLSGTVVYVYTCMNQYDRVFLAFL